LILTASYGSGHNEAARCIAGEVARRGADPVVVDHFRDLVHPLFDRATRAAYLTLLRRLPGVWGLAYAIGDRLASDSPLTFGASRVGARRLGALLDRIAPDAVVTVHATPAVALAALARAGRRLPDGAGALARVRHPLVGVLVAGHDAGLRATLERLAAGSPLRVFGFVPDVHRLMAAADLVVTKAGGMTLAEAMAVQVPLLFYGSLPGQERRNERF